LDVMAGVGGMLAIGMPSRAGGLGSCWSGEAIGW
jgi:hypothetical protein